jgi:hypothetical protein
VSSDVNLGAPKMLFAPEIAYRQPDVYHAGSDLGPRRDVSYKEYQFVGRYRVADEAEDARVVRARAKEQYGRKVDVYRTARWWVVYRVR